MFFQETEIAKTLNCPMCKSVLEDPRILPCGETVCNSCIALNTTIKQFGLIWNEPRFKCICEQEHPIPTQGFPLNKIAASLAEKKPIEVYRGADAKQLSDRLNKIVNMKAKLIERDAAKETVVKNYFEFLRFEVQLAAESLTNDIVQLKDGFVKTINQFETKCLERIQNDLEFQARFKRSLAETDGFIENWTRYLSNPEIKSADIERALQDCRMVEKALDEEHENMKKHAFNNRVPSFKANPKKIEKSQLGTLSIEFLGKLMFDKMSFIDLKECLKGSSSLLAIDSFENENYVFVTYLQEPGASSIIRYRLATFDRNSNPLRHYTLPFDVCVTQKDNFHVITFGNQTVFALTGSNSKHYQQQVYVFDEDLKIVAQMPYQTINSQIQCIEADNESIYVLAGTGSLDRDIYQFSWNLQKKDKPMTNLNRKYIKHCKHMYARKDYLFLVNEEANEIVVLDKSNGALVNTIANLELTNAEILFSNEKMVLKDNKANRIKFYDLSGELESEIQIDKRRLCKLKFTLNKATEALIFYDDLGVYL